ncbi:amino acid ABC transporter permease [Actinomyces johnsonii]|uniref:ABC transporter, permease protein n=2 Tax=Actinomyces johnsonii TaxID=544581 RepID=U1Q7A1_9ACTO|nr:amino acid ABC transporter permease [Actinomyces johnsonii]ERH17999.1 ABC transporter, permease protein [Actinomyces johnsonii F0510]KAA8740117.1 amino acid ABC transporter permease [Actinomyces johnsonii]TQD44312.1 amino acid ABC transporter permease [Actinomyces johnsonii]
MSSDIMPMTDQRPAKQRGKGSGATDAALLFDEPGPRGRVMIAIGSVIAVLGIVALLGAVLYRLDLAGQLDYPEWRYFLGRSVVSQLLEAAGNTLSLGAVAAVLTFPLGIVLGWLRLLDNRPVRWLVGLWIDAMRAVPMLLLVYFFLLVVPRFVDVSDFWKLALPIIMCTSATTAEVFRSGVRALDRGQTEAALALGMSRSLTMRLILAPQALRLMLPTLITQMVTIIKGTTLAYVLAYPELMYRGSTMIGQAKIDAHLSVFFQTYVIIAVAYVIVNWALGALARRIGARTR